MSGPLLVTKLHIPQVRTARVLRPRLVERLRQGMMYPLTLVSAPAGFGKTTLLCEWLEVCQQPTAWVSLDKGDNDPVRFWSYAAAALQTLNPSIGQSLAAFLRLPTLLPPDALLTDLINELAEQPQACRLVLDDYHLIETQAIHDGLLFLLEHAPAHFRLILISRANPPWPLARLRARGQLVELRAADLRFTPAETAEFLNRIMQLDLAPEDTAALEERTEGWIAGLQMAALSLQGHADPHRFIAAFTGSNRFIFDYLVEEVLQRQPTELQEFLLKTSLLERLTAALCNTVLGQENSEEILSRLDRANLFVIPLDETRCWYRYHHLFAGLLRSRLEQTWKEAVPALNRKASAWCEQAGLIEEAVSYAQACGDPSYLATLLENHILTTIALGEISLARRWLSSLPENIIRARPILCVAQGWVTPVVDKSSLQLAEGWMNAAEAALRCAHPISAQSHGTVSNNRAAFQVMQARLQGQPIQKIIQLCLQALDLVADQNPQIRSLLLLHLGDCYLETGESEAANRALDEALRGGIISQNYNAAFSAINMRLMRSYWRAEFTEAMRIGQEGLALALQPSARPGWRPPNSAVTYAALGMILLERNDLAGAHENLSIAVELFPRLGPTFMQARCYLAVARVKQLVGGTEPLPDLSRLASAHLPEYARHFAAYQASIGILPASQAMASQAVRWADGLQAGLEKSPAGEGVLLVEALALAQVRLAQRQAGKGQVPLANLRLILDVLAAKLEEARDLGQTLNLIEIQIQCARLFHCTGQQSEAAAALGEALRLAEPEGIARLFLDAGEPLPALLADQKISLERAVRYSTGPANALLRFVEGLLTGKPSLPTQGNDAKPDPLIQSLSEREVEILRLLNTSLDSTEIAARLYISVSTVRTHIKNIYAKLNVNRRIAAVQRAAELGLI